MISAGVIPEKVYSFKLSKYEISVGEIFFKPSSDIFIISLAKSLTVCFKNLVCNAVLGTLYLSSFMLSFVVNLNS